MVGGHPSCEGAGTVGASCADGSGHDDEGVYVGGARAGGNGLTDGVVPGDRGLEEGGGGEEGESGLKKTKDADGACVAGGKRRRV